MAKRKPQSVEPNVADLVNSWLKRYNLDYKLQQEPLDNGPIDKALLEYESKQGGNGGNRPDAKLLLADRYNKIYPILIEYKGYEEKLEKLDSEGHIWNRNEKGELIFKNIKEYAVNGAVHYANAILHYTTFEEVIAIGVTGYKDSLGKLQIKIGVYDVSKSNLGAGQKVGEYTDLSFLKKENFDNFIDHTRTLQMSAEELAAIKEQRDQEINVRLKKLNNEIFKEETGLSEKDRVYLVASTIIATLGTPGRVEPLSAEDLKSSQEEGRRDGDIMLQKITAFFKTRNIPTEKRDMIVRTLQNVLISENLNIIQPDHSESQLKRVFRKVSDDLGCYYKIGLSTDFTGKLFNEMYSWLGFSQDKLNDVVLTPFYVATLLAKLARVNKDSYVWDFATGSAGLLVAAMNEMLRDAREKIKSPDELARKEAKIKAEQLLGLEVLPDIYMLAVLNMIMMGDGSSNLLNEDSLRYTGNYGFSRRNEQFPADAFVLNPPYSQEGCGMIFVQKAFKLMNEGANKGYAAIIIQNSAGSGKAIRQNREILQKNTLLASIKMPIDLFAGKSSVQTYIYVFKIGEPHDKNDVVKFIDFSNDGYARNSRKKSKINLKDVDHAQERYEEVANLVRFGKKALHYLREEDYYENVINPNSGKDWNQHAPIDIRPTIEDFKKTVSGYLAWEVSNIIKQNGEDGLGK